MDQISLENFVEKICTWYAGTRRDLPWRATSDPYCIWVSEVMLQQTQVDRVLPKYVAFTKKFPTVHALARAAQADVVRMWAGLGYNRRAILLHRGAQAVIPLHGGMMPRTLEELKSLPGIGEYTARAILSFAYHEPVMLIDTNHRRVIQRIFFGQPKHVDASACARMDTRVMKKLEEISIVLARINDGHYIFNQALMDLGAMLCTSTGPQCAACPFFSMCKAGVQFASGTREKRNVVKSSQGKFEGSKRWYRGKIVALLRTRPSVSVGELVDMLALDTNRICAIMESLVRDGLVCERKGRYTLA